MQPVLDKERYHFDAINFQALILLEELGNRKPSQDQIDEAETLIRDYFKKFVMQLKFFRDNCDMNSMFGISMYHLIQSLTVQKTKVEGKKMAAFPSRDA